LAAAAAFVAVLTASSGSAWAKVPAARAVIRAPKATVYRVDGRSVSMTCRGSGPIPVVFLAGGADSSSSWHGIVAGLGRHVLTCAFDRPYVYPSQSVPGLLTPKRVSDTLEQTLAQAHLTGKVLLVGHSIGGLEARVFGAEHPDQVAGAVFLDPSEPDFMYDTASDSAEFLSYDFDPTVSAHQVAAVTHWPDVPVFVLSHDPKWAISTGQLTAAGQRQWAQGQEAYAHLSAQGTARAVPGATHLVYQDDPAVVVATIKKALARAA
jgi:triacylglycerol esterase/lipase EstA (alpha/beta hydrolase family)